MRGLPRTWELLNMPRRPDMPCAGCGKLMWRGGTSLPAGQARCRECRSPALAPCGSRPKFDAGCRCDACREGNNARQREFFAQYKERHGVDFRRKYDKPRGPQPYSEAMRRRDAARRARKVGATIERFDNAEVFERDGWICGICSDPVDSELTYPDPLSPSLDHVVPLSKGGEHSRANTRLSHLACNLKRGAAHEEFAA